MIKSVAFKMEVEVKKKMLNLKKGMAIATLRCWRFSNVFRHAFATFS